MAAGPRLNLLVIMDRDTVIAFASLPDSRTRATVSGFFCEAQGRLQVVPLQSSGSSPEDVILRALVTKFINIAVCIAGDSESVDDVSVSSPRAGLLEAVG